MTNLAMKKLEEEQTKYMSKAWIKFFAKFNDIETLKVVQWSEAHLLGYICKRYEDFFKTKFAISVKGAPSKSSEIYQIRQIMATLQTSNTQIIKDYIDWTFDQKIIPNKIKLKKIGFFITQGFATEFYLDQKQKKVIKRSTSLPQEYLNIAQEFDIEIETYGDLAFIKMANDLCKSLTSTPNSNFLDKLKLSGFDISILDNLAQ